MTPPVQLLAVDIDGTLLDSTGQLPDAHRTALADATTAGVAVVLATGRALHFAQPVRNVHQAHAASPQIVDDFKQARRLVR